MKKVLWRLALLTLAFTLLVCLSACFLLGGDPDKDKNDEKDKEDEQIIDLSRMSYKAVGTLLYTGSALTPDIEVTYSGSLITRVGPNGTAEIDIAYSNNVNVGEATATLTAKSGQTKYKGTGVCTFQITNTEKQASTCDELVALLADPNNQKVVFSSELTVPADTTLEIAAGVRLQLSTLNNYGTIDCHGDLLLDTWTYNYGTINVTNGGSVSMKGAQYFNNNQAVFTCSGKVNFANTRLYDSGVLDFSSATVKGTVVGIYGTAATKLPQDHGLNFVVRGPLSQAGLALEAESFNYAYGTEITPKLTLLEGNIKDFRDYTIGYLNNIDAGTGKVVVSATDYNEQYIGSVELPFQITPIVFVVSTYLTDEALADAFANPNYSAVRIQRGWASNLTVPTDGTLQLAESLQVGATLTNNGTVQFLYTANLVSGITLTNNGTCIFDENVTIRDGATLTNNGVITARKQLTCEADFTNDGLLNAATAYFNGNLHNANRLTVSEDQSAFFAANITGTNIANSGTVYVNSAAAAAKISGNGTVVTRTAFSAQNVALSDATLTYTGDNLKPSFSFTVQDEAVTVPATTYTSTFRYDGADSDVTYPKQAGSGNFTVTFNNTSTVFCGSALVPFSVTRTQTTVANNNEFSSAVYSSNYDTITLSQNVNFGSKYTIPDYMTVVVPEDVTLSSAFTLTVRGKLVVNGTYNNTYRFTYSDKKENIGQIVIDGDGVVQNNGHMVFNGTAIATTGDGTVTEKPHITDSAVTITVGDLEYYDTTYFWTHNSSAISVSVDGQSLLLNNDNTVRLQMADFNSGDHVLTIYTSSMCDKMYGYVDRDVTVNPGRTEVSTFVDLCNKMFNRNAQGQCNYQYIRVTADLEARLPITNSNYYVLDYHNASNSPTSYLRIPKDVTVDFRGHGVTVVKANNAVPTVYTLVFNVCGTLVLDNITTSSNGYWIHHKGTDDYLFGGTVEYHVTEANKTTSWDYIFSNYGANKVVLDVDLTGNWEMNPHVGVPCQLDLNGHSIDGTLTVRANWNEITITSSQPGGSIHTIAVPDTAEAVTLSHFTMETNTSAFVDANPKITATDCTFGKS